MNKEKIINALSKFAHKRPMIEPNNYGFLAHYRKESREVTKDLHHARALLAYVERSGITGEELLNASKEAFSGRLSLEIKGDDVRVDYCTGQYFPTEYRKAVCSVMARALWNHWLTPGAVDNSTSIRKTAVNALGKPLARAYFN